MSLIRSNRWHSSVLLLGLCIIPVGASARHGPAAPVTGTFNHGVFSPTTGRVGYHMPANFGFYDWDEPTGNNSTCDPGVADMSATGTIPPGLTLLTSGTHGFDGTPRQPGDWTVRVTIGRVACKQGPDQTVYGPRTIDVHFHIDP
jgi:hypothetical protein